MNADDYADKRGKYLRKSAFRSALIRFYKMEEGKYIYCIIKGSTEKRFGPIGINNQEVSHVHYKDISAVVSPTPVINFDRLDKKELVRHVAIHQQVNEEMMKGCDIVPMTFGIIAPSVSEVLRILERAYLQFKTALKKIEGKVEFAVQVRWDPKKLLEELVSTNPEIRKLKQKVALKGSILGMPTKLRLGKLIQKEAEIRRQTFINDIQQILGGISHGFTSNKLIGEACPVGSPSGDSFGEMIANFSFLIEKTRESELDKKMQELGKKYEGKLRFKYIGPMPPYSFVNINLGLGNFELINKARKLLGLAEYVSFDEIKKAYYTLSHKYHPDKHGGESKTEEKMKKIAHAYNILENYCQSCDELLGQKSPAASEARLRGRQKYSFRKEDIENSIIIK